MFVEYFVGISETPGELKNQIEKALEYTEKWTVTANVKTCTVDVCNDDKVNPVSSDCKWDNQELAIVDQNKDYDVETTNDCSWGSHIEKVIANG